jgi:hypothetical protein
MAGGIDWFRWHHGSVTDPKFQLVARKAGVRLPDVLAVWAFLLEKASAADERGTFGDIDHEAVDCLFGLDDGATALILEQMGARGLTDGQRIAAWEKRQPKRERDTDSSAERTRAYRERQKRQGDDSENHVTPCDATEHQKNAREEKSREEQVSEEANASSSSPAEPTTAKRGEVPCPYAEIIAAYHELLPMLPSVRIVTEKRKREMRKLWGWVLSSRKPNGDRRATSADEAIRWFREYFARCADDAFITGQTPRGKGHEGWEADLSYLLREDCLVRIAEKTGRAAA